MKIVPILSVVVALLSYAHAVPIINTISGDEDSLHVEFGIEYGPWVGSVSETLNGTWAGGSYTFNYLIGNVRNEGQPHFLLAPTWNNGFFGPEIKNYPLYFGFGVNTHTIHYEPSIPDYVYTNHGFSYFVTRSVSGSFTTAVDTHAGSGIVVFDIERVSAITFTASSRESADAVPEHGKTLLLLVFSVCSLIMARMGLTLD